MQRTVSWLVKEVCLDKQVKSIYSGLGPKWSTSVIATRMEESNNNKSKTELHIRVCISVYLLWYFSSHISSAFSLILHWTAQPPAMCSFRVDSLSRRVLGQGRDEPRGRGQEQYTTCLRRVRMYVLLGVSSLLDVLLRLVYSIAVWVFSTFSLAFMTSAQWQVCALCWFQKQVLCI